MCPGVAVLAGGGDGGGGSGGSGKNKKGKKGAGTKKGKKAAGGGKKSAKDAKKGKCGKGGGASCSGCSKKPSAGDPIDIASGEVISSAVDLTLPGPIELEFLRHYNSARCRIDRGLGFGWLHPFCWSLTPRGHHIEVVDSGGETSIFHFDTGSESALDGNWLMVRTATGFVLDTADGFQQDFRPLDSDRSRYVLARIEGPCNNQVVLHYDDRGRLREVIDSAGRTIRVEVDDNNRLRSLSVAEPKTGYAIVFATYDYDQAGNLVRVLDADGAETCYSYDEQHRLVSMRLPSSLTYHYVYDGQGRCVEGWGDYPDGSIDPALDPDLPRTLADGQTIAKGLHHVRLTYVPDGFREVVTSTEVQRYESDDDGQVTKAVGDGGVTTRQFDHQGNVIAETNRNGETTSYEWDPIGQLMSETDPLGNCVRFVRDVYGNVVEMVDAKGGVVRATRTADGLLESLTDQNGATTFYDLDDRGLTRQIIHPNGARSTYEIDAHGNCTAALLPDGETWRWRYDWWGRLVERIDPAGNSTRFAWSAGGKLASINYSDGSTRAYWYDAMGNVVQVLEPDGSVETRYHNGLNWDYRIVLTTGDVVEKRYDREGKFTRFVNERGEHERWQWNPNGVSRVVAFDGHEQFRRHDALGHLLSFVTPNQRIAITRNAMAQPVKLEFSDGTCDSFDYDAFGQGTCGIGPDCEVRFVRNAVGDIVRESIVFEGEETVVDTTYAAYGSRLGLRTSSDHQVELELDARMQTRRMRLDGQQILNFEYDTGGRLVRTLLPEGASIENEWDELRRLRRRTVLQPGSTQGSSVEPEWVGKQANLAIDKRYRWSARHNLVEVTTNDGTTSYTYDRRDRLVRREPEHGVPEHFAFDAASNVFEAGPNAKPRVYGPGNRLEVHGSVRYIYDEAGFPLESRSIGENGVELVCQYAWGERLTLDSIERSDGLRVKFYYDAYRRRVAKKAFAVSDGGTQLQSATRYVWDQSRLIHSIKRTFGRHGEAIAVDERTYIYHDGFDRAPIAERIRTLGANGPGTSRWCFYSSDMAGTPEELLAANGRVIASLQRAAYGRTSVSGLISTQTRFPGQFEDEETGLHYNFMRYFDPDAGRYISPDPMGLAADWNAFTYCRNPISEIDPLGLHGLSWAIGGDTPSSIQSGDSPVNIPGGSPVNNPAASGGSPDWSTQSGGCTERKLLTALDDPKNKAQKKRITDGEPLNMKGEYPPCKKCHKAMKRWAKKNLKPGQGSINYHFPVNQKITYTSAPSKSGRSRVGVATVTSGPGAPAKQKTQGLVNAYDSDKKPLPGGSYASTPVYDQQKGVAKANKGGATAWP